MGKKRIIHWGLFHKPRMQANLYSGVSFTYTHWMLFYNPCVIMNVYKIGLSGSPWNKQIYTLEPASKNMDTRVMVCLFTLLGKGTGTGTGNWTDNNGY